MLHRIKQLNPRNLFFSGILLSFSLATGIFALARLPVGMPANMGPGYFPVLLSGVMAVLSAIVAFLPGAAGAPPLRFAPPKATIIIVACPVMFAFMIQPFGLVISLSLMTFLSCLASRKTTVLQSLFLTAGFTGFCIVIFHYLLDLPIPLWGTLLGG